MRYVMAVILLVAGLGWNSESAAQPTSNWFLVTDSPYKLTPGGTTRVVHTCPSDAVPLYRTDPNPNPNDIEITTTLIDSTGSPLDPSLTTDQYRGAGNLVLVTNKGTNEFHGNLYLHCMRPNGPQLATSPIQRTLPPGQTTFLPPLSCPSSRIPVGLVTNADGSVIQERARVYLISVNASLTPLNNLAPGTYVPYSALGMAFRNTTAGPLELRGQVFCADLPNAQTIVNSADVIAGAPHEVFAPVPDGFDLVGNSFTVSSSERNNVTLWDTRGHVSSPRWGDYSATGITPRGVYLEGRGVQPSSSAKQQVVGRAVIGSIVMPSTTPVPPPTVVQVVEFYHAGLDHYFITANPNEISDLDTGVHVGWQRTGESFNAYGVGSSGRTGRRPVCRAYGNPAAGLDSHFYSASPQECAATLENFGDDWLPEASEVFELELPDTTTGACAADRVPIHRLWNSRADSSHRFVKTLALRAQMIARGFVSEGYGPNGVVFCALP